MKTDRLTTKLASLTGRTTPAQSKSIPSSHRPTDLSPRTLRVEGTGEAKAEPDEGWIDVAVETRAPTAKAAGEENARRTEHVIAALTAAGIPRQEIDTQHYTLFPEYAQPQPDSEPKLIGYRASNTLSVHMRELARMGDIIDQALAAGANRVDGVRFALSNEDTVRAEALKQAVERAHRQAEVLASSLGIRLGPVLDASTVAEVPRPFLARMSFEAVNKGGPTTPILPEEQTLTARVTVTYSIEA
jgi:uncharacterized protein YggE